MEQHCNTKMKIMNTYRLLRNNRETGPFTSDELIARGFKPYDLIWVEGKSAGWRYPGEIPEFNVVAPVVENQPFERYAQKSSYLHLPETPVLVPAHHLENRQSVEQKLFTVPKTSIYVTLPGNAKGSTHRVILASKQFHRNKQADSRPPIISEEIIIDNEIPSPSPAALFIQEEVKDSSLALQDAFAENTVLEQSDEHLLVEFQKPRKLSLFSKISLAAAVLLFGFSLVLFTNAFIQKKQKAELAQMVKAMKSKNNQLPSQKVRKTQNSQNALPLMINPEYIISTDALALASEAMLSITNPVLADDQQAQKLEAVNNAPTPTPVANLVEKQPVTNTSSASIEQEPVHPSSWLINLISIENSDVIDFSKPENSSTIVITNNSPVIVDFAEVTISSLDASNQLLKKEVLKIEKLLPGSKKELQFNKSGKESSLQYSISSISYKTNE